MTLPDRALFTAEFTLTEKTDPATPPLGCYTVFPQVDGNLYMKDSFGRVYPVGSPPGSLSDVKTKGATLTHQIAIWEDNITIKGEIGFTYNAETKEFAIPIDSKFLLGNNVILSRTNNATRLSNINSLDTNTTSAIKTALNLQFTDVGGSLPLTRLSGFTAGATTEFLRRDGGWGSIAVPPDTPIGVILPYAGRTEPTGWLWCDGRWLNGSTYLSLYRVLVGNPNAAAVPSFQIPDMRNKFPLGRGSSYAFGSSGGEANVTLNVNQMPSHSHATAPHSHSINDPGHLHNIQPAANDGGVGYATNGGGPEGPFGERTNVAYTGISVNAADVGVYATGGGQSHNNMPPYLTLEYIIKVV